MAVFLEPDANKTYYCPQGCGLASPLVNTIRKHCADKYGLAVTTIQPHTQVERRARQRERMRSVRASQKLAAASAASPTEAAGIPRPLLTPLDAEERGGHLAENPVVIYGDSMLRNVDHGVFAAIPLRKGDVVTRFDGRDGEAPVSGCGLAGFVNNECRARGVKRKNCELVRVGTRHYMAMLKDINMGDELYTTRSKQCRVE